ncbi:MAG TPA: helix-turn-helix transcriptional regulator, partial [Ktedonobacteraceae bacterium]|nr:helix-turn-helix transcriptional regulator [Ktedonobacteraceae bacterium]
MSNVFWWSRYGDFSSGLHNLPHMGEVIAHYRRKRYRTQEDFRIAAGVTLRTVQEWESNNMTADMGRRIFLAKMLKIPP